MLGQVIITLRSGLSRLEQMRDRENSGRIPFPKLGGPYTDFTLLQHLCWLGK